MGCSPDPRTVDEGLDWFLSHDASGSGMCAQHTWHSLGGDRGCPPAWGCSDANEVYDKVKKSGRYWTTPKRGDIAVWKYGSNGHAARVYDDAGTLIATTNPTGESGGGTGIEPIGYPSKWGATSSARIFTDTYNGIKCFESGDPAIGPGNVYVEYLVQGKKDSDSVKRLQDVLNGIPLEDGTNLPVTGNYLDQTAAEVSKWQKQKATDKSITDGSKVTNAQAEQLFLGSGNTVIFDDDQPDPQPPDPEEPVSDYFHDYTGKPSGDLIIDDSDGYVALDAKCKVAPFSGFEIHMLYANCELTWDGSDDDGIIRIKYVRDAFGGEPADDTGYQDYSVPKGAALGSPDGFLITATHWEDGEKGRGGKWYLRCAGAIVRMKVGTRYAKVAVLK